MLKGKKSIVVGAGKSGISAAGFLAGQGADVILNDLADLAGMEDLDKEGVRVAGGGHRPELFLDRELIVLSPGVPASKPPLAGLISDALKRGAEVISELELGYRFIDAPVIAVTGTNGKSTVTTLIERVLDKAGKKVFAGGNLGTPLTEYLIEGKRADIVLLEVSSFQLERIESFKPFISIMLNITADHLDRYASMEDYVEAKKRIFMNQDGEDFAILNMDDEIVAGLSSSVNALPVPFGSLGSYEGGIYIKGNKMISEMPGRHAGMDVSLFEKNGIHNIENGMAAFATALLCGLSEEEFSAGLEEFQPLPHRMELVGEYKGIRFYDDSKATNVGAAVNSLSSARGKVVLIAGGKDKGGSYEPLKEIVREKARGVVLIGEAAKRIESVLGNVAKTIIAEGMEEALEKALGLASPGDSVVLSPACSSFDMYKNYVDRGKAFQKAFLSLTSDTGGDAITGGEVSLAG